MRVRNRARVAVTVSTGSQRETLDLYQKIQRGPARLIGATGTAQRLPLSLHEFLVKLLTGLSEAQSVAVVRDDAQLTTVEAARLLGVSRQFLIKLLERDEIRFHMVGTHRRIYVRDLLAYKAKRDGRRRQALDELTRAEAEEGLYGLEPPDDRAE